MNKYVADTMALILRLENRKMPHKVKDLFLATELEKCEILIPPMVFAELSYLSEKNKIDTNIEAAINYINNHSNINDCIMSSNTVKVAFEIKDIPELHDRLIAASAKEFNCIVITNDPDIEKSEYVSSVWK